MRRGAIPQVGHKSEREAGNGGHAHDEPAQGLVGNFLTMAGQVACTNQQQEADGEQDAEQCSRKKPARLHGTDHRVHAVPVREVEGMRQVLVSRVEVNLQGAAQAAVWLMARQEQFGLSELYDRLGDE